MNRPRSRTEKAGYKDTRDYFQQFADLSQSVLSMYGAVAAQFSEPVARRFGVTCLYLLLGYTEAAGLKPHRAEQCSTEEMRRALRGKRPAFLHRGARGCFFRFFIQRDCHRSRRQARRDDAVCVRVS